LPSFFSHIIIFSYKVDLTFFRENSIGDQPFVTRFLIFDINTSGAISPLVEYSLSMRESSYVHGTYTFCLQRRAAIRVIFIWRYTQVIYTDFTSIKRICSLDATSITLNKMISCLCYIFVVIILFYINIENIIVIFHLVYRSLYFQPKNPCSNKFRRYAITIWSAKV